MIFQPCKILLFIIFTGFLFSCFAGQRVCIVLSEKNKIYNQIEESFENQLSLMFPALEIKKVVLDENTAVHQKEIQDFYPDVNFAIGAMAVKVCDTFPVFPFIYTMVLNPGACGLINDFGKTLSYCSGISVIIDPEYQFSALKQVMPGISKIGTLYSEKSKALVEKSRTAMLSLNLTLFAEKVEDIQQVPQALGTLMKNAPEFFWLILDTNVLSDDTFGYLISTCKTSKVNILTFNPNHLKEGASVAVYLDYAGLGHQAAKMASRVLKGESVTSIPVEESRYTLCKVEESNLYLPPRR